MKVLHLVPQLFGPGGLVGGAERYAQELARAMAPLTPTRLIGFGPPAQTRREGPLAIHALRNQLPGARFRPSPAGLGLLRHFLWADVIQCHQIYTMGTSGALLFARLTRKPVYVIDHAGGGVSLDNFFPLEAAATARLWVSRMAQAASKVPPGPCDAVIYGGVDAERFVPGPPPGPGAAVLFVGRLLPEKGPDHLVESAAADMPVTLLGPAYDGRYFARLQELARGKRITFAAPVDGPDLVRAYQQCACLVVPRVEPLGLTALEAMACGRPVIAIQGSGIAELLEEGRTGWTVPPREPEALRQRLAWVLAHPAEAAAVGRAGRALVEQRYTWSAIARRCLDIYTAASTSAGSSSRHTSAGSSSTR